MELALERNVVEDFLQDALSVVECSFDCDAVDIFVRDCRHLAFLKRRDTSFWEHDEDVNTRFAADAVDCSAARVAAGRTYDVQTFACAPKNMFEDVTEKLESHVFERQRRTMEQLADVDLANLAHRNDVSRRERRIAALHNALQGRRVNCIADIKADQFVGEFGIGERPPEGKPVFDVWNNLWNQEAAVVRKSHHDRCREINRRNAAARAYVVCFHEEFTITLYYYLEYSRSSFAMSSAALLRERT